MMKSSVSPNTIAKRAMTRTISGRRCFQALAAPAATRASAAGTGIPTASRKTISASTAYPCFSNSEAISPMPQRKIRKAAESCAILWIAIPQ